MRAAEDFYAQLFPSGEGPVAVNILFLSSLEQEKPPAEGILTGVGVAGCLPYKERQLVKETKLV